MARIKIQDLPKDMKISKEEMKNVLGGGAVVVNTLGITGAGTLSGLSATLGDTASTPPERTDVPEPTADELDQLSEDLRSTISSSSSRLALSTAKK